MNNFVAVLFMFFFLFRVSLAEEKPQGTSGLKEQNDKVSYSLGYQIGGDLKQQNMDIDTDALLHGITDGFTEEKSRLSPDEMRGILVELKKKVVAKKQADIAGQKKSRQELKEKYRAEGREFLAENAKKEGVLTLPSGLQYKVTREGQGITPGPHDEVTINYRGTLIDGTEFGSTYNDGKPETFRVDGVIPGLSEALQLMKEGSKWHIFIPFNLAYGERGGPVEDKTVIYEVELISVKTIE